MDPAQTETNGGDGMNVPPADNDASAHAPFQPRPYDGLSQMLIGGLWRPGRSDQRARDVDPFTGETLLEIQLASAADLNDAYESAKRAQVAWAATGPQERRNVFLRAAFILERRKEEIVEWLVRESGSTRAKAGVEWRMTYLGTLEAASIPFHLDGRIVPTSVAGKESRVYRQPAGVVGVISPWNFPLHLSNRSVAPALAVGDAVVLKPASDTPVTGGTLLAKIYEEAGLPPEVLNVVVGSSREIGDLFVDHPIPRVISFTGSTEAGRRVAEHAGRAIKRVCLELGGNGPFLVLDDADLDRAVRAAVAGKFLHQGQICLAINRLLVDTRRYDDFVGQFVERVKALKVGDPDDLDTAIGPIINRSQLETIVRKVDETVARGARVLVRGQPRDLVLPPIVLADVTNDMPTAREEVFGPVASILRVDGEEEAIRIANTTDCGLSSAVFTRDLERGARVAKRIEAGMTHVNDWPINDEANAPFGGEKASGLGRYGGMWAVEEMTTLHWISLQEQSPGYPI